MKPWKQVVLIGALGLTGAIAGLGAATLILGPGALLGTPVGEWVYKRLYPSSPSLPDGRAVISIGDIVPPISLNDVEGQVVSLQPGGRPLLINYWASWCPPCVEEMPMLDALASNQAVDGVQVVGIALDESINVIRFLDEHPVDFPIRLESAGPSDSSVMLGNTRGVLPYSVLIDAEGRLQKTKLGAFRKDELESWIAP